MSAVGRSWGAKPDPARLRQVCRGACQSLLILPIEGGPAWIHTEFYDVNAKAAGNPRQEVMEGPMMQALLEERFRLKIHRETREISVYALIVIKASKLNPFKEGSCVPNSVTFLPLTLTDGQRPCKALVSKLSVLAEGATTLEFSKLLNLVLDRPVIDKTGLSARFDIHLEFSTDQAGGDDASPGAPPRSRRTPEPTHQFLPRFKSSLG